jgi:two-component sensor histidine kinase
VPRLVERGPPKDCATAVNRAKREHDANPLSEDPGGCLLHMKWQESGGPPLVASRPTRGFGTRLIERTVKQELNGDVRIEFASTGLVCEFHVPLQPTTTGATVRD